MRHKSVCYTVGSRFIHFCLAEIVEAGNLISREGAIVDAGIVDISSKNCHAGGWIIQPCADCEIMGICEQQVADRGV